MYCIVGIASYKVNNKKSYEYLSSSIDYLKSEGNNKYISKAYNYLGLIMYKNKNYKLMESYLQLADSCFNIITYENINQKLNIIYNLSLAYYYQHKYSLAVDILLEALTHSKKHELYYSFGEFNMLLALCYKNMGRIDDAIDCNIKSLKYYKLTENKLMEHRCYINMSILFRLNGDHYNSLNYINDAIIYFESIGDESKLINAKVEKIIGMFVFNNDRDLIVDMVDNIINQPCCSYTAKGELLVILASLKLKNRDYNGALSLYKEAEKILFNYDDTEMNVFVYQGLNIVFKQLNDLNNANLYLAKLHKLLQEKSFYNRYIYNHETLFEL